jgi:hypothetical protein
MSAFNLIPRLIGSVFIKPQRSLAGIQADAVLEEHHEDNLVITDHPVEEGAVISDHAYKMPAEVTLEYGWSMSSGFNSTFDSTFLNTLYQQLLQLQVDRTLFDVFTGKRKYSNMLVSSLSCTTDKATENVLLVRITCKEILRATTQVVQLTSSAAQLLPQKTAPIINQGNVGLRSAPNFNASGIR